MLLHPLEILITSRNMSVESVRHLLRSEPGFQADHGRARDVGFHEGELAAQRQAGAEAEAARLTRMLDPAELGAGIAALLARGSFAALTGRDAEGILWISPLTGPPGFLHVASPTQVQIAAGLPAGDPLHNLPAGQPVGMVVMDFATRRRVRINGRLTESAAQLLVIDVEQGFGNCPQYIRPRALAESHGESGEARQVRLGGELSADDRHLIGHADTFFLGTTHSERGSDASHRGGPPGFVRAGDGQLWWPEYPGNNLFNSLGNLMANPEAALLFPDFATGRTLQVTGTANIDWGPPALPGEEAAGSRRVRVTPLRAVTDCGAR
jgi:uncharacterized protein